MNKKPSNYTIVVNYFIMESNVFISAFIIIFFFILYFTERRTISSYTKRVISKIIRVIAILAFQFRKYELLLKNIKIEYPTSILVDLGHGRFFIFANFCLNKI